MGEGNHAGQSTGLSPPDFSEQSKQAYAQENQCRRLGDWRRAARRGDHAHAARQRKRGRFGGNSTSRNWRVVHDRAANDKRRCGRDALEERPCADARHNRPWTGDGQNADAGQLRAPTTSSVPDKTVVPPE